MKNLLFGNRFLWSAVSHSLLQLVKNTRIESIRSIAADMDDERYIHDFAVQVVGLHVIFLSNGDLGSS